MTFNLSSRRAILNLLRLNRIMTAGEICAETKLPSPSLKHILDEMRTLGQVRRIRRGVYAIGFHLSKETA